MTDDICNGLPADKCDQAWNDAVRALAQADANIKALETGGSNNSTIILFFSLAIIFIVFVMLITKQISTSLQNKANTEKIKNNWDDKSSNENKWKALKEVDPEIRDAVQKVIDIDKDLEHILADKFLAIGSKDYLDAIVNKIIESHNQEKQKTLRDKQEREEQVAQENTISSKKEEMEYRKIVKENGYDYRYAARAVSVEAYVGTRDKFHGGICVRFDNDHTLLIRNKESEIFRKGDDGWM